jgi:hypothetical protein
MDDEDDVVVVEVVASCRERIRFRCADQDARSILSREAIWGRIS